MRHAESESTRLAASRELLDHAVGRPALHAEVRSEIATKPRNYREMSNQKLEEIISTTRAEREQEQAAANGETGND